MGAKKKCPLPINKKTKQWISDIKPLKQKFLQALPEKKTLVGPPFPFINFFFFTPKKDKKKF